MKFYVDENITPNIAQALAILQNPRKNESIEVFTIKDEFGKGTPDEEWIPKVAAEDGVVITQDLNIHRVRQRRKKRSLDRSIPHHRDTSIIFIGIEGGDGKTSKEARYFYFSISK